jgi:hypothetical protein
VRQFGKPSIAPNRSRISDIEDGKTPQAKAWPVMKDGSSYLRLFELCREVHGL